MVQDDEDETEGRGAPESATQDHQNRFQLPVFCVRHFESPQDGERPLGTHGFHPGPPRSTVGTVWWHGGTRGVPGQGHSDQRYTGSPTVGVAQRHSEGPGLGVCRGAQEPQDGDGSGSSTGVHRGAQGSRTEKVAQGYARGCLTAGLHGSAQRVAERGTSAGVAGDLRTERVVQGCAGGAGKWVVPQGRAPRSPKGVGRGRGRAREQQPLRPIPQKRRPGPGAGAAAEPEGRHLKPFAMERKIPPTPTSPTPTPSPSKTDWQHPKRQFESYKSQCKKSTRNYFIKHWSGDLKVACVDVLNDVFAFLYLSYAGFYSLIYPPSSIDALYWQICVVILFVALLSLIDIVLQSWRFSFRKIKFGIQKPIKK
ncbi:uncharacterized protein LOC123233286 [Gracilinanus agilis]|uniref:uncharacterized protein LOC123233286 n=1 Tax=Gracilinanus agilis TaxID=191870 RepID=UPI001CFDB0D6|nr:uncharacterized protein LOC123233286 [Gracilinanus agilis]